jgi:ribosomal protein L11 methyltransferase
LRAAVESAWVWRLALEAPSEAAADAAAAALELQAYAVSIFDTSEAGAWRVEGFAEREPDKAALIAALSVAAASLGADGPADLIGGLLIEKLPQRDWLAENRQSFPPIRAGRYFIHGSHHREGLPPGAIGLLIDAATAFGTGEHATTRGCLLALDGLRRRGRRHRILDMGTGTGILAIAAAKTWRHRRILACDIDAGAARVAAANARANGVGGLVRTARTDGYRAAIVRRGRPYDLVFENILARPLASMAPRLARALAPGGIAVLSGLLARQEAFVLAAHRAQGLHLVRRLPIAGWHTLVLMRKHWGDDGRAA